jgi:hypothetical protein
MLLFARLYDNLFNSTAPEVEGVYVVVSPAPVEEDEVTKDPGISELREVKIFHTW